MQLPILAQITNTELLRDSLAQAAAAGAVQAPDQLTVWDLISLGSWFIMGPLALMSLVTIYIVIERMLALSKANREDKDFMNKIRDYVHEGKIDSAKNLCTQSAAPSARMVEKGLQRMGKPAKEIESAMESAGRIELTRLEKGSSLLRLVARLAPMFGFIGTIIGVIKIFYDISLTDNISIAVISTGLYQKMVTSAGGLIVGIVAFAGYHLVHSMVEKVTDKMERTSLAFMDLLQEPTK
ncbi:MAG: MotA/TolQ/ExbB proton channel family protein [Flavobacteriales bacterium]|nr:MotA/TolQ/ExbB proton channel family protein [Flavobacteriales bacterium]